MAFTEITTWINDNTGVVMSALTIAYVVTTGLILWEARRSNKHHAKAIQQASDLEAQRSRPYLVFNIDPVLRTTSNYSADWYFEASLTNSGRTSAHNVRIRTDPQLLAPAGYGDGDKVVYRTPTMVTSQISIVPPGNVDVESLGPTDLLFKQFEHDTLIFQAMLSYESSDGRCFEDQYSIDLAERKDRVGSADPMDTLRYSQVDTLSKIADQLDNISSILNSADRGRAFAAIDCKNVSQFQRELLDEIWGRFEASGRKEFLLSVHMGGSDLVFNSDHGSEKLQVDQTDIEQLCRAGLLIKRYDRESLFCTISEPMYKRFLSSEIVNFVDTQLYVLLKEHQT
jgi:hypothetical protein